MLCSDFNTRLSLVQMGEIAYYWPSVRRSDVQIYPEYQAFLGEKGKEKSEKGRERKERNACHRRFTGALSLLPSPLPLFTSPLLSSSPLGRPDTQASPDLTTLQPTDRPLSLSILITHEKVWFKIFSNFTAHDNLLECSLLHATWVFLISLSL